MEKISTKDSQVTFNEIDLQENQMIPSEISKEDSLISNVVFKTSTACPSEGSLQSEILASTKDTIPQEAPNALDVKDSNLEEGSITPFKDVSEIDPTKNGLQINDGRMAENFADQTLIDDGNDEFFASLDLADEEKSEESSKHFSNILPMTSTHPKASLNMQQPEMIFGHNSYNPQCTFM